MSSNPESVNDRTIRRLREFTVALESGELLGQKFSGRKIILDLVPEPYSPALVLETRKLVCVSQALFAQLLGVSTSAVQKWERGAKVPTPMACRFMDEIRLDPGYWKGRVAASVREVCASAH